MILRKTSWRVFLPTQNKQREGDWWQRPSLKDQYFFAMSPRPHVENCPVIILQLSSRPLQEAVDSLPASDQSTYASKSIPFLHSFNITNFFFKDF